MSAKQIEDAALQAKMIAVKRSVEGKEDASILQAALNYGAECYEAGMKARMERVLAVIEREAA